MAMPTIDMPLFEHTEHMPTNNGVQHGAYATARGSTGDERGRMPQPKSIADCQPRTP
jgi:hypothetical protein